MLSPVKDKHIACARCRERKVKCDGMKPNCRRCQRNGHACEYIRGKKQRPKSEWIQHLRTFSAQPPKNATTIRKPLKPIIRTSAPPEIDTAPNAIMNATTPYFARGPSPINPYDVDLVPKPSNHSQDPNTIRSYASTTQCVPELTLTSSLEQATCSPQPYTFIQGAASTLYTIDHASTSTFKATSPPMYALSQPEELGLSFISWRTRSTTPFSQASEDSFTTFPSTMSNLEGLDVGSAWRSHTPFSQGEEEASLDGLLDPSLCYNALIYSSFVVDDERCRGWVDDWSTSGNMP